MSAESHQIAISFIFFSVYSLSAAVYISLFFFFFFSCWLVFQVQCRLTGGKSKQQEKKSSTLDFFVSCLSRVSNVSMSQPVKCNFVILFVHWRHRGINCRPAPVVVVFSVVFPVFPLRSRFKAIAVKAKRHRASYIRYSYFM